MNSLLLLYPSFFIISKVCVIHTLINGFHHSAVTCNLNDIVFIAIVGTVVIIIVVVIINDNNSSFPLKKKKIKNGNVLENIVIIILTLWVRLILFSNCFDFICLF